MKRLKRVVVVGIQNLSSFERFKLIAVMLFLLFMLGSGLLWPLGVAVGLSEGWASAFGGILLLAMAGGSLLFGMYRANIDSRSVFDQLADTFPINEEADRESAQASRNKIHAVYLVLALLVLPLSVMLPVTWLIELATQRPVSSALQLSLFVVTNLLIGVPSAFAMYRYIKRRFPDEPPRHK